MLPGIISIARLHPYEYIYYNNFIGGVSGAFRSYEFDYWYTSFREAAEYLNTTAEQGAKILVWGDPFLAKQYTRKDTGIVEPEHGNTYDLIGGYNYAILSSRGENDTLYSEADLLFSVEREGAILVVVKRLSPTSAP